MLCYYCHEEKLYFDSQKCKTVSFKNKEYILCLNCSNELINKKTMKEYFCIKIDKRKKIAIEWSKEFYKTDLQSLIDKNEIYVNQDEDDYTTKEFAKKYMSREEAEDSITEDFEIVVVF